MCTGDTRCDATVTLTPGCDYDGENRETEEETRVYGCGMRARVHYSSILG